MFSDIRQTISNIYKLVTSDQPLNQATKKELLEELISLIRQTSALLNKHAPLIRFLLKLLTQVFTGPEG